MATVTELNVIIAAKVDKLEKGLKSAEGKIDKFDKKTEKAGKGLKSFNKNAIAAGKTLAGAFITGVVLNKIGKFIGDSIKLAAEAEGVSAAFKNLNQPGLLNNLRQATRGTVSDLELMRKAVQANNFKIPLDTLATGFKFATNRAIETGESVDFLVDSLVNGIGRKSSLVLDNLGISATELQEEIKKTGDFSAAASNIMNRALGSSEKVMDTAAVTAARLNTELENQKVIIGTQLLPVYVKFLGSIEDTLAPLLNMRQYLKAIGTGLNPFATLATSADDVKQALLDIGETDTGKKIRDVIAPLNEITDRDFVTGLAGVKQEFISLLRAEGESLEDVTALWDFYKKQRLDALNIKSSGTKEIKKEAENIRFFQEEIKRLQDDQLVASKDRAAEIEKEIGLLQQKIEEWKGIKRENEEIKKLLEDQRDILNEMQVDPIERDFTFFTRALERPEELGGGFFGALDSSKFDELTEAMSQNIKKVDDLNDSSVNFANSLKETEMAGLQFTSSLSAGIGGISSLLQAANSDTQSFGKTFLSVVGSLLNLVPGIGPILSQVFNAIGSNIPSFAAGGIVSGPQLAIVGDNPGRKEAIIPSEMFGQVGGGFLQGEIKGEVIRLTQKKNGRINGKTFSSKSGT